MKLICEADKDCHSQMKEVKSTISIGLASHAKVQITDRKRRNHKAECVSICLYEVVLTHRSSVDVMFTKRSYQAKKNYLSFRLETPYAGPKTGVSTLK